MAFYIKSFYITFKLKTMKKNYLVSWSIDIFDAESPKDAAMQAWNKYFKNNTDSIANVFVVRIDEESGAEICVDLNEELETEKMKNEAIYNQLGAYLSNDKEDYSEIVNSLREHLTSHPGLPVDYVEYNKDDSEPEFIEVWEKLQYQFRVKEFCDLVGIK